MTATSAELGEGIDRWMLPFPGSPQARIDLVGGKGHSLIQLSAEGHAVPPGLVLTSRFFAPWIATVVASVEWRSLPHASTEQRAMLCALLKQQAACLPLTDCQRQALDAMPIQLADLCSGRLFAVRSSSPQEDLPGTSFAGGYATFLGVRYEGLVDAIRACFASLFDERVIVYKLARGISLGSPSMAVVIQQQIDSEVSGVAFSLNPRNNDYDEAVIDANWGLGETVVAGEVTPDHWVIDKTDGRVIEQRLGSKRMSRWLQPDGRLLDRTDHRCSETCLTTDQVARIATLLCRIESRFGHPVDVEWAIAHDVLYLLQARPVTAFVPLPDRLTTLPGQRRRLYMDIALSSGLTMNAPISPMGLDVFRRLFSGFASLAFGRSVLGSDPEEALVVMDGGRMFLDFSNVLWLTTAGNMARSMEQNDASLARLLEHLDAPRYQAQKRPNWARWRGLWRLPVLLWRVRRLLLNFLKPLVAPQRSFDWFAKQRAGFEASAAAAPDDSLPLDQFWDRHLIERLPWVFTHSLAIGVGPGIFAVKAFSWLTDRASRRDAELMQRLDRGFAGNVVVEMNAQMHTLASLLTAADRADAHHLAARLHAGDLPPAFLREWQGFLQRSGCRGPMEMDIAHPRYADAPAIALQQIAAMPVDDQTLDLAAAAQRQVERRRDAAAIVIQRAGPLRRGILQHLNRIIDRFAGLRDTPKLHFLMLLRGLRRRLLLEGKQLHHAGRLDRPEQVFELELDELMAAGADPELDLRAICAQRRPYYISLASQVVNFPSMIDSRGRIPRPPPRACRAGEFAGVGLAPGLATGFARTLRSPHDAFGKGEVLIAYTTDPGWTPVFATAAAVVLEIGGALQHGAVVARELGLPCVAGIDGITNAIADGQLIEVDGSTGVVRLLS